MNQALIKLHVAKFGVRETADEIVNFYIFMNCGLHMDDILQSPALCDVLDEVEDIISQKEINMDDLRYALECLRDEDYMYDILH